MLIQRQKKYSHTKTKSIPISTLQSKSIPIPHTWIKSILTTQINFIPTPKSSQLLRSAALTNVKSILTTRTKTKSISSHTLTPSIFGPHKKPLSIHTSKTMLLRPIQEKEVHLDPPRKKKRQFRSTY